MRIEIRWCALQRQYKFCYYFLHVHIKHIVSAVKTLNEWNAHCTHTHLPIFIHKFIRKNIQNNRCTWKPSTIVRNCLNNEFIKKFINSSRTAIRFRFRQNKKKREHFNVLLNFLCSQCCTIYLLPFTHAYQRKWWILFHVSSTTCYLHILLCSYLSIEPKKKKTFPHRIVIHVQCER